jgi:excinuclease ABC subunit C
MTQERRAKSKQTLDLKQKIEEIPDTTGVYIFKDAEGKVLYVGKAKSLKNRVKSHFSETDILGTDALIISHVNDINFMTTDSEIEALLLESELIKQNKPKYNVRLQDDKSFPYFIITDEEFPRVMIHRIREESELQKYRQYFGPYTDVKAIKQTLAFLLKLFPVCSCKTPRKKRSRPCLKYQLKKCSAPCVGAIGQAEYLKNISNIELFLDGKKQDLIEEFRKQMQQASDRLDFERATILRDQIWALEKAIINQKVISSELSISLGVRELQEILNLHQLPARIEAFDISNISGTDSTGSMILFLNGQPLKSGYRQYKIRSIAEPNDVAMMGEVIERRYGRLIKEQKPLPNLIVVDGGKPQLNIAYRILTELGLNEIPIIGLAKRFEHVFKPDNPNAIIISPDSPALFLLKRIRDEAHRFALRYHHILRKKRVVTKKKDK